MTTRRRGPRPAGERLRRLLVMLPWLMEQGEATVAAMTERFEISEAELLKDIELVAMCGLPPYIDEMIDVWIDEGVVYAGIPRVFTKPLRLTAPEGFALLTAGRAAMQLPGADTGGALDRALRTLGAALGDAAPDDAAVLIDNPPPASADGVAQAAADGARLRIRYWSAWRDEVTEREVTPRAVFTDRGRWYLIADDRASGEERRFRIDRIEEWARTGEIDPPRPVEVPTADEWFAGEALPEVVLRLAPSATWVAESYPVRARRATPDGLEVGLTVASERWLRALLLRLGDGAEVLDPPEWRGLAADAAAELLRRYEASGS
jgi:proteasome accessory factor C